MSDLIASIIRTAVPSIVGVIVGWLTTLGVTLPKQQEENLSLLIAFAAGLLWYVIVRALEQKWPALGVLLGVPKQPAYGTTQPAVGTPKAPDVVAPAAEAPAADPQVPPTV